MPRSSKRAHKFGIHASVAGGLPTAFERGARHGCDCIQVFVKNQRQWKAKPLSEQDIADFKAAWNACEISPVIAHSSYLINIASPKLEQWTKSIDALVDELTRCEALGISGLVLHPGAHMKSGELEGIRRAVQALDTTHLRTKGFKTEILIETTAGQGTCIGHDVSHIGRILRDVARSDRLAVCLDTCHLFTAGYDLSHSAAYEELIEKVEQEASLSKVKCIHLNDSKSVCGSKVDRHAHIGEGHIGLPGFSRIVNDSRLAGIPMIIETPDDTDGAGRSYDDINLAKLRELVSRPCHE